MVASTLYHCEAEVSPQCPGHKAVDKFPDCLTEALYGGFVDEQTGTVDGFGWWVALIIQNTAETVDTMVDVPVTIPAGTFMVIVENDRGHIGVETFPTAEAAQACFDQWDTTYGEWLEIAEIREATIAASMGRVGR